MSTLCTCNAWFRRESSQVLEVQTQEGFIAHEKEFRLYTMNSPYRLKRLHKIQRLANNLGSNTSQNDSSQRHMYKHTITKRPNHFHNPFIRVDPNWALFIINQHNHQTDHHLLHVIIGGISLSLSLFKALNLPRKAIKRIKGNEE